MAKTAWFWGVGSSAKAIARCSIFGNNRGMPAHEIFFFGALFFLCGVLAASAGWSFLVPWFVGICIITGPVFFFFKKRSTALWIAGLSLFMLVGTLYFQYDDQSFRRIFLGTGAEIEFMGIVADDPSVKDGIQELVVEIESPGSPRVLVRTTPYPAYAYGDAVKGSGNFNLPQSESYAHYLAKERISAIGRYPKLERVSAERGVWVYRILFRVKHAVMDSISDILPAKEASLLKGLLLGETSSFSAEFSDAMKQSGTTHLVALSGYNITILLWAVMSLCVFFVSRRTAIYTAFAVMLGFVLMTGAEASVVRAAIMGSIVLLAGEMERPYDTRNAILFAAVLMALHNPKVLAFDVGFQLSFFALLGLVYLKPALGTLILRGKKPRYSSLSENMLTTLAAQLAVIPVLLGQFGTLSLVGIFSNIVILETIPLTMGLGFAMAGLGMLWKIAAIPLGWVVWVLLHFQIAVIGWFGSLDWNIKGAWGIAGACVYYAVLAALIVYARRTVSKLHSA